MITKALEEDEHVKDKITTSSLRIKMANQEILIAENHAERCRTLKFNIGPLRINLNPVVSLVSAILIWGLVAFCLLETDTAATVLPQWTRWVTAKWTWLYIGTQDVCGVFIIVLLFSKYSKLKLGKPSEKPEFGDVTYFTMLFAAGIGVGLFYFGVAEPIYHYEPGGKWGNRYQGRCLLAHWAIKHIKHIPYSLSLLNTGNKRPLV